MGVAYSAVSGYGFVLDLEELCELAVKVGFVTYDDDPDEAAEWLCSNYGVHYAIAGDAYSGEIWYLIGDAVCTSSFAFREVSKPTMIEATDELTTKLQMMLNDLGIDRKIAYYSGLYVY